MRKLSRTIAFNIDLQNLHVEEAGHNILRDILVFHRMRLYNVDMSWAYVMDTIILGVKNPFPYPTLSSPHALPPVALPPSPSHLPLSLMCVRGLNPWKFFEMNNTRALVLTYL